MADSAYLREAMAAVIQEADMASLHTADPSGTGANEVSGGSYARVAITGWTAGDVDGIYRATLAGAFDLPPNTAVQWVGLWNGSTYLDKGPAYAETLDDPDTVEIDELVFTVTETT